MASSFCTCLKNVFRSFNIYFFKHLAFFVEYCCQVKTCFNSFACLIALFFVKQVVAFGEAAEQLERELEDVTVVASLEAAVAKAKEMAETGDAILLSPGCASFDMFQNFEHRGEVFKQVVEKG